MDPFEKACDDCPGTLEFLPLAANQHNRPQALRNRQVLEFVGFEIDRSEAVAPVDKQLGLGRDRVEINRCSEQNDIAVDQLIIDGVDGIVQNAPVRLGTKAAGLARRDDIIVEPDNNIFHRFDRRRLDTPGDFAE